MECELLVSSSKDPKMIARVKESIWHSADGSSSHRADALKLGLRKAIELIKQKKQPPALPGVLLRCGNSTCEWHKNPVPLSSVGSNNVLCRMTHSRRPGTWYMQCASCGDMRFEEIAACRSCRRNFA